MDILLLAFNLIFSIFSEQNCIIKTKPGLNVFLLVSSDVGGKVIHLVERAPPPPSQPGSGSGGSSADSGATSSTQGPSQVPSHDRNANSYVMLGTFNLPVNIMDPQQIQVEHICVPIVVIYSNHNVVML